MLGRHPMSPGLAISSEAPDMCHGDAPGSAGWPMAAMNNLGGNTALAGRMAQAKQQAAYRISRSDGSGVEMPTCDHVGGYRGDEWDALGARKAKYQSAYAHATWQDRSGSHQVQDRSYSSAETSLMGGIFHGKMQVARVAGDPGCSESLDNSSLHGVEDCLDGGGHDWSLPQSAHLQGIDLGAYQQGGHPLQGGAEASTTTADMLRRQVRLSTSNSFSGLASAGFSGSRQASATTLATSSSYNNLTNLTTLHHHLHHHHHQHHHQRHARFSDASTCATGDDNSALVLASVSGAALEGHGSSEWSRSSAGTLARLSADTTVAEDDSRGWRSSMETVIGSWDHARLAGVITSASRCQEDSVLGVGPSADVAGALSSFEEVERVGYSLECEGGRRVFIPKRESTSGRGRGNKANTGGPLGKMAPLLGRPVEHDLLSHAVGGTQSPLCRSVASSEEEHYRSSLETVSTGDQARRSSGDAHRAGGGILDGFLPNLDHEAVLGVEGGELPGLPGAVEACWPMSPDHLEEVGVDADWMMPRDAGSHAQGLLGAGQAAMVSPVLGSIPGTVAAIPLALGIMAGLDLHVGSAIVPVAHALQTSAAVALPTQAQAQTPPTQQQQQQRGAKAPSACQPRKSKEGDAMTSSPRSGGTASAGTSPRKGASGKKGGDKGAGGKGGAPARDGLQPSQTGEKKARVDWTPELHLCFTRAVDKLGLDKAIPSEILELMGVSSLTRHNIASHLQKYRSRHRRMQSAAQLSEGGGAAATASARTTTATTATGQVQESAQLGQQVSQQAQGVGAGVGNASNSRARGQQRKARVSVDVTSSMAGCAKRAKASPKEEDAAAPLSPPQSQEEPAQAAVGKGWKKLNRRTLSQVSVITNVEEAEEVGEWAAGGVSTSAPPSFGKVPSCASLEDFLPGHFTMPGFSDDEVFLPEDDDGSSVMVDLEDADGASLLGHDLVDAQLMQPLSGGTAVTGGNTDHPSAHVPIMTSVAGPLVSHAAENNGQSLAGSGGMPLLIDDVDAMRAPGVQVSLGMAASQASTQQGGHFAVMGAPAGNAGNGTRTTGMMPMGTELQAAPAQQQQQQQQLMLMMGTMNGMGNADGSLAPPVGGDMFQSAQPQLLQSPQQQPMDSQGFFMQPAGAQAPMQWAPSFDQSHGGFLPLQPRPALMEAQGGVPAWSVPSQAPTTGVFERGSVQVMMLPRRRPILPRLAPRPPAPPVIQRNLPADPSSSGGMPGSLSLGIASANGHMAAMTLGGGHAQPQRGPAGVSMGGGVVGVADRTSGSTGSGFPQPGMKWGNVAGGMQVLLAGAPQQPPPPSQQQQQQQQQQGVAAMGCASTNAAASGSFGPGLQWMQVLLSPSNTRDVQAGAAAGCSSGGPVAITTTLPSVIQQVLLNPLMPLPVGLRSPNLEEVMTVLAKRSRGDTGNVS